MRCTVCSKDVKDDLIVLRYWIDTVLNYRCFECMHLDKEFLLRMEEIELECSGIMHGVPFVEAYLYAGVERSSIGS